MSSQIHPLDKATSCIAGGRNELAQILGVTPSAIGNWKRRGVPIEHCFEIERATKGVVSRKDLCSNWQSIWPELAAPQQAQAQGVQHA